MGRKSKLTDELIAQVGDLLAAGHLDKDVCAAVGISTATFYGWLQDGETATRGRKVEFLDAVTRARSKAMMANVEALQRAARGGMRTVVEKTVLDTETRIGKDGKPYKYKKEHTERVVTHHAEDWRAALEYLKRRDPDNWSEKVTTEQHITIESAIETAADEFENIIRRRAESGGTGAVAGQADDAAEGGASV